MEVGGHVLQVGLELLHHARIVGAGAGFPVGRAEVVALDELMLAVEHQLAEAALTVSLDRRHVEVRRLVAVGVARHVRAVDVRRILVALLVDVQVAEAGIQQPGVRALAVLAHVLLERGGALVVGERDAHHPQSVLDQLAVGALELLQPHGLAAAGAKLLVQHAAEGRQALERERLLEQRPAALVQALLVERRACAAPDDGGVGALGIRVALVGKQQLAASELHLIELRALRVALHDPIQCAERLPGLAGGLIGARQLIEHLVVTRIVGVSLKQRRVELDRLGPLQVHRGDFLFQPLHLAGVEVEVAETAQGLGAQLRIGILQLEKVPIVFHRPGGVSAHHRVAVHVDLARGEIPDGGLAGRGRQQRERERRREGRG